MQFSRHAEAAWAGLLLSRVAQAVFGVWNRKSKLGGFHSICIPRALSVPTPACTQRPQS